MTRALLIAGLGLAVTGCASFAETWEGWDRTDRALHDAGTVCIVTDYLQTESALDTGRFREANPLYGSHPSDDRLAAITGGRLAANWFLADSVPARWRTEVFAIALLPCAYAVIHNHQVGVRIEL